MTKIIINYCFNLNKCKILTSKKSLSFCTSYQNQNGKKNEKFYKGMIMNWQILWKCTYITDCTLTGPISYYYLTNKKKNSSVIKGFTLNYKKIIKT